MLRLLDLRLFKISINKASFIVSQFNYDILYNDIFCPKYASGLLSWVSCNFTPLLFTDECLIHSHQPNYSKNNLKSLLSIISICDITKEI